MILEKYLYPSHLVPCNIIGPSCYRKSVFVTNIMVNIIEECDKLFIYSLNSHQYIYQKLNKSFSYQIPIIIFPNILNEDNIVVVIEQIVIIKDVEKSDTDIKTCESIEEKKFPQEYEDGSISILKNISEREVNNPGVQAMFKRSRHNKLSIFIISQDYYELPRRIVRANGIIYHLFRPKRCTKSLSRQS